MTLEETFEKIDVIMEKLSDDDLPLEDSFKLYKDGMELLDKCQKIIEDIEERTREVSQADDT